MSSQITINPALTTVAAGTFGIQWDGLIQGMAMPDPAVRNFLASGIWANANSLPSFGGLGISEAVPTPPASPPLTPDAAFQGQLIRATNQNGNGTVGNLTGFSVFDQGYSGINSPQSEVPLVGSYGQTMFYRFGSGARIAVACDTALAAYAQGNVITKPVSWDFLNQKLISGVAAFSANTITAGSWAAGVVTLTTNTAHGVAVGSVIVISGISPTGYNGTYVATTGTTGSTLKYALASDPGAYVSDGDLAAGGGYLNARVLKVMDTNCMTVSYNSTTGFASWNRNGSAALILI